MSELLGFVTEQTHLLSNVVTSNVTLPAFGIVLKVAISFRVAVRSVVRTIEKVG